ncbi:hypothetical protein CAPTEDRAFT_202018 [Capitella teleta]|uniref:Peptidase S1 domain-containing protein n=1 Tax=Capitella teleta TaxID=283909 RepID=R7TB08_CAPTE|nr:hypothetical protein CAPTEDRAFT_202018 [Capitella teleta]|eukprot:ELT88677.1 hypothetical protein CAPTEDRAFT_202018 [Capitella teleta]
MAVAAIPPERQEKNGKFGHTGGAVLIDSMHALCAAHCFMVANAATDKPYYKLYAGDFDLSMGDAEQLHDIAMIRFNEPADLSNPSIKTIKMVEDTDSFAGNDACWITGWRRACNQKEQLRLTHPDGVNIPVTTNQVCQQRWRRAGIVGWLHTIMAIHICVDGEAGEKSACQKNNKFVPTGITSRGSPDCEKQPSVYIRVSKYLDWARSEIAKL